MGIKPSKMVGYYKKILHLKSHNILNMWSHMRSHDTLNILHLYYHQASDH